MLKRAKSGKSARETTVNGGENLDYTALEKSLDRNVISPVYLFYGEETYLRDKVIERFKTLVPSEVRDFNLDIVDGRECSVDEILSMANTLPFMSERRITIIRNADFFKTRRKSKSEKEAGTGEGNSETESGVSEEGGEEDKLSPFDDALIAYLENPPDTTCLVFVTDSAEKRRKTYKLIAKKGQVVEFLPLKGRELNEWVSRRARQLGKVAEPAAVAILITAVGNNLQQLNSELAKLTCYSHTEKISAADVELMVSRTAELNIFELVDAIGERNYKKAVRMTREMVFQGEPVFRLLFMIARQFRLIVKTKSMLDAGGTAQYVAEQLKVQSFVAQKCIRQARNFSMPELVAAMEKILDTDARIKSGRQEQVLALELLIIALCEK